MKKHFRFYHICLFALSIAAYFSSEYALRVSAIDSIRQNSQGVGIDKIVSQLPTTLGVTVKRKIDLARMRDAVDDAKTPEDKVRSISTLAIFVDDPIEKDTLFKQVLTSYPIIPASSTAMIHCLNRNPPNHSVSIDEFQRFIASCPADMRPGLWQSGLGKIQMMKPDNEALYQYLQPLLTLKPDFKDYQLLYSELKKFATLTDHKAEAEKADELETNTLSLKSVQKFYEERETAKRKAEAEAKKKVQEQEAAKKKAEAEAKKKAEAEAKKIQQEQDVKKKAEAEAKKKAEADVKKNTVPQSK